MHPNHTEFCFIQPAGWHVSKMCMTQPQHQYSKTATYIVNCVYIYIYIYLLKLKWKYYCIHNCSYILKDKNQTTESTGSGLCKFISAYRKMQKSFMHHLQQLHMPFTTLDALIVNQLWVEQPKECCIFLAFVSWQKWTSWEETYQSTNKVKNGIRGMA